MDKKTGTSLVLALFLFVIPPALKMFDFKSQPLTVTLVTLCVVSLLYAGIHWWTLVPRVALYWRWDWPWWGLVPVAAATELAFRRLQGTDYEYEALEQRSEEERMDHMATYIVLEAREIYGRKPPGALHVLTLLERQTGHVHGGGTRLHGVANPQPFAEDLHILRSDFWAALSRIKQSAIDL